MRKFPFVKRTIVSVLCVALLLTGNLSTMATEVGELVTESTETVETTETMVEETTEVVETETTDKNDKTSGSYSLSSSPANDESASDVSTTFAANEASGLVCTFVDEDGTTELADPVLVSKENGTTKLPGKTDVLEKEGYELYGWEDSEKTIWAPDTTYYNVTKNETLKAVWKQKCTITFDAGKGSFVEKENLETVQTKLEGESLYLPGSDVVTRTGYTFDGWSDGTNTYKERDEYTVNGNVTFTAVWKNNSNVIETVDTTSKGVTITLFDYKANSSNNKSESVGAVKIDEGYGINSGHKLKFINDASGNTPLANRYTGGSGVRKSIVATTLSDGFPKLSGNTSIWGSDDYTESLSYLFDGSDIENAKKVYPKANYLFTLDSEGYYSYDSDQNFATIADDTGNDFIVYADKGSGFFPFTAKANALGYECNNTDGDILGSNKINHYFGMMIETEFLQPASGKINGKEMIFEFSGDDDVWVFIDGILAMDLGGIHQKACGSINFATGDVKIGDSIDTKLSALGIKLEDYSVHTMKFFYLERGNWESNCKIKFNLQTVPEGSLVVSKNAIDVADGDTSDYVFVLEDSNGVVKNASYTIGTSSTVYSTDENGVFILKSGQSAVFANLESGKYYVTETDVKNSNNDYKLSDFSTRVSVNGGELTTITAASGKSRTANVTVSDAHTSSVDFRNLRIKEEVNETKSVLSKVIRHDEENNDYDLTLSFKGPKQELTKTESLFSGIAGEIITESESHITKTYKYASKVTLTDTLSEYVDIVEKSEVIISVKNTEGKEVGTCRRGELGKSDASYTFTESDVTLTASYSNKVVTLSFPENYELDEDYTYAVTFTVKASETAYNEYEEKKKYANVGDENTDAENNTTSSGKQGFNSNTEAKVTYFFGGNEKTEYFDHPVIQVDAAKLILVKHNEKGEPLSGVTFTLYKDANTTGVAKTTSENGKLDFGYLTSGNYRLVETAAPKKYALLDKETQALTFTVSKGVITFANGVDAHWTLPKSVTTTTAIDGENVVNENSYTVTVYNDLARIWNIYKISASSTPDNMIYLEGAEFTLSSADHTYYGKSGSDGKIIWYSEKEYITPVEEIAAGTYILKETLAPTGYAVNEDWTLVIGKDNSISGFEESNASYDEATKTYTIYYKDEALYSLPSTGGAGIFAYMFGGMFLMMAGALYIFVCRRKAYRA